MARVFFDHNFDSIVAASFGNDPRMIDELHRRGNDLIAAARNRTPVKRGNLINQYQPPEIFFRGFAPGVRVINSAPHALAVHDGAAPRIIFPRNKEFFVFFWIRANRPWFPFWPPPDGPKNWVNWPGMAGNPFFMLAAQDLGYDPVSAIESGFTI